MEINKILSKPDAVSNPLKWWLMCYQFSISTADNFVRLLKLDIGGHAS